MKTMMALFMFSFAAALVVGASTPATARMPAEDLTLCPPTIYACCGGGEGTAQFCATQGGNCGPLYVCGRPF